MSHRGPRRRTLWTGWRTGRLLLLYRGCGITSERREVSGDTIQEGCTNGLCTGSSFGGQGGSTCP